jgi:hypothetical protein
MKHDVKLSVSPLFPDSDGVPVSHDLWVRGKNFSLLINVPMDGAPVTYELFNGFNEQRGSIPTRRLSEADQSAKNADV